MIFPVLSQTDNFSSKNREIRTGPIGQFQSRYDLKIWTANLVPVRIGCFRFNHASKNTGIKQEGSWFIHKQMSFQLIETISKNFDTDYILKFPIIKFADSFSNKITHKKLFIW